MKDWLIFPVRATFFCAIALLLFLQERVDAEEARCTQARGGTLYVPVYSHVYYGDSLRPFYLAVTVSIRNINEKASIEISRAEYRGSDGKLLKEYVEKPIALGGLQAHSFKVEESEKVGGSGASMVVSWKSKNSVLSPIVESVMIGTAHSQGISFTSRAETVACNP